MTGRALIRAGRLAAALALAAGALAVAGCGGDTEAADLDAGKATFVGACSSCHFLEDAGTPQTSDGPFAEAKEFLGGFYLVDVEDEARALEIATKIVEHIHEPIEVRRLADGPPEEYTS